MMNNDKFIVFAGILGVSTMIYYQDFELIDILIRNTPKIIGGLAIVNYIKYISEGT